MSRGAHRIIRAPNHLGDVVAALPAMVADGADVMVVEGLEPLLDMAGVRAVVALRRGLGGWRDAVRVLRSGGYAEGALLTPAFSAAWLFRCGGVRWLRGTATDARGWMLETSVPVVELHGVHRTASYGLLLGVPDAGLVSPVELVVPTDRSSRWAERLMRPGRPLVGFFPGANAPARRWAASRFAQVAGWAEESGAQVVVLGGMAEASVTQEVAAGTSSGIDLGGRTDLYDLAAVLALCDAFVTNDTGPMHLAGMLHTPTVSLWGPSDREEVRPLGGDDRPVTGPDLPCKPCCKNKCPRSGPGTVIAEAHEECMKLIQTDAVISELASLLGREAA